MTRPRRLLTVCVGALLLALAYFSLWPVPIKPAAWTPPAAPALAGDYQPNDRLSPVQRLPLGKAFAPEDIAIDPEGRIYTGVDDGRIIRLQADGSKYEVFANTNGRPLGLVFDQQSNLIVADAIKGLLSISPEGTISVLTTTAEGIPFQCTNDLDVSANGLIYFTDASSRFPLSNYKADILEHRPNGRFLVYDPEEKTTRVLLSKLHFANGVAVSPDQQFVLVVETGSYRVHRFWLGGPKRGQSEVFIENLPGFPDGISSNARDKFWLALVTPRDKVLDRLLPHPFLRKVVLRLPGFLQPAPKRHGFILGLDHEGNVVENLQDGSKECYAQIANVVEHEGSLYFGSIGEATVGRLTFK